MKKDIILSGVGGQGIVSIAAIIGTAALDLGLNLKQSEVHGMSQRGGDVMSNLRISDQEIHSDLIPEGKADLIISVEPLEALRHLPMLAPDGWLITNTNPYNNIANYPPIEDVLAEIEKVPNHIAIDADQIAKDIEARRSSNVVILGAACPFLELDPKTIEEAIKKLFGKKGEMTVNQNLEALKEGRSFAEHSCE
ncbi:MAG: indolepyruvate oxidoreductase subunit beta [Bacteroidales bacterium]|nr:indolepyruvate oxidoreductase subunit beta [Bacteroidales bacterium]MCF8456293.1 indolepyruvate oxidoreductase subunit beta [Bacteroidales bacterium]